MATLAENAKRLNKEFKNEKLIIKSDIVPHYERLACGALGMDYPLFGGLPLGRICVYSGLQHSGKTTAACCELAAYQRKFPDKTCVFIDAEHALDIKFQAIMNGIDLDKLYYVNVPENMSGEQVCDLIVELQKSDDIGMIVLDSLPALVPEIVLTSDLTKDAGMRSTMAKKLYPFLNIMTGMLAAKNNILILINQVRQTGTTFTGLPIFKEPCGGGPQFLSSVSVRFGTRTFTKGDDMDYGKGDGEGADGFRLKFKIMKNKTANPTRGGGFITYRYATGLDYLHDTFEIALAFDYIHRVNNVTYELINLETGEVYNDDEGQPLRGKKADLISYLVANEEFRSAYMEMLTKHITTADAPTVKLLDSATSKELDVQEEALKHQYDKDIRENGYKPEEA